MHQRRVCGNYQIALDKLQNFDCNLQIEQFNDLATLSADDSKR